MVKQKTNKRNPKDLAMLEKLYSNPMPSSRTGDLFNAVSYPTKISPEAIALFIVTHTRPGAVILDTFGGSGTTGLATLLCDRPTEGMKRMAAQISVTPEWGPRRAVLYEIGTWGSFISKTMCNPVNAKEFELVANNLINRVETQMGDLYSAIDPEGNEGQIRHVIWSDVLRCPRCQKETSYFSAMVERDPLKLRSNFICPSCRIESPIDFTNRVTEDVYDPLLRRKITRKKRIPAIVYGETDGKNWCRPASDNDRLKYLRIIGDNQAINAPISPIIWGDLYRSGYHSGITHLHHFYTYRNFLAINNLWQAVEAEPAEFRDALRLLILSYNATHATLMTRVVIKNGQKDFVLTGAQSGVLYISSLPVEKNIFKGLRRKVRTISKAFALVSGSKSKVEIRQASSTRLAMPDESVDYVFTDPPFGGYIPYAEVNQINEIWLGKTTDRDNEIIISHAQDKSVEQYGMLMKCVLGEIFRTLKQSGKTTIVFHSAKAEIWQALTEAYELAGFGIKATSILDKIQESFKQVVSTSSVKGDPLLLLEKRNSAIRNKSDTAAQKGMILDSILNRELQVPSDSKEMTPERMYSRFITRCLEQRVPVDIDADDFYEIIARK